MEIFGFEIQRKNKQVLDKEKAPSFVPPVEDDGTPVIQQTPGFITGAASGQYIDMEGAIKNEADLIRRYREMSLIPECDAAIDDIVNESITGDMEEQVVDINLDKTDLSDNIKNKIREEFEDVISMMHFNQNGHDLFRKWYVDGRIYFHKMVNKDRLKQGIVELRNVDPLKIKKVREVEKEKDPRTGMEKIKKVEEFFVFNDKGFDKGGGASGQTLKIAPEAITFVTSGLLDYNKNAVVGYLHKAIKPANQLRMMEDALVIYRITRAPERRIFYIDVGNLPKAKAEQYLADVMTKYRNKLVYNANTGEIKDDRRHMSMLEDFWLPRREGGRGTEISTLPGGQNLSEIEDIQYFQKKLYKSLNVPVSRLESETGFSLGRASEITRDEVKFSKFVDRIRKKFGRVFTDILQTQCVLKGILSQEEFEDIKEFIQYDFNDDNHFTELKETEVLRERLNTLREIDEYVGKYYSKEFIRKRVLQQSDDDIKDIDKQIEQEKELEPDEGEDDMSDLGI
jgi:hypothetical protein